MVVDTGSVLLDESDVAFKFLLAMPYSGSEKHNDTACATELPTPDMIASRAINAA